MRSPGRRALALVVPPPTDHRAVQAQGAGIASAHAHVEKLARRGLARAARIVPPAHDLIAKPHRAGVTSLARAQLHKSALRRAGPVASQLAPPADNAAVSTQATGLPVARADLIEGPGWRGAFPELVATPADDRVVGHQPTGLSLAGADKKDPDPGGRVRRSAQLGVGCGLGVRNLRGGRRGLAATGLAKRDPEQEQRDAARRPAHRLRPTRT
jgi:hypothetical protein